MGCFEETLPLGEGALRETHLVAGSSLDNALCPLLIPLVTIGIVSWLPNATLDALKVAGSIVPFTSAGDPYMDFKEQTKTLSCWKLLPFLFLQLMLSMLIFAYIRNVQQTNSSLTMSPMLEPLKQHKTSTPIDKGPPEITILLWTWPFGKQFNFPKCSSLFDIRDCHFTVNRSWYAKADAVVVHHRDVCYSKNLPSNPRPPSQRWIWFNLESPSHSPNLGFMDNHFNLTMSYRRDSDIFSPYGWLEFLDRPQNVSVPPKSKLVAWVVSNWNPRSRRVQYYQELKKYIQIDVYGEQHLPLSVDKHFSTLTQYKFYLSFENSIHEDYITEKIWKNAFLSMAVPVVCGPPRKNYERFLPSDSFIHIDDFPSAQEMARFLQELDKDDVRYQSYFRWRLWLKPVGMTNWGIHYCKACRALQKTPVQYTAVPELSKWFK
ncbi:4-galactosyl-N-acetylglucosaminide 3-alpha-L-fucosyltransferase FUT6-like [Heteronotia binoei]|uniref:4-galactosyl-N-acetylglucosaminide 3-alpha-L-fucosyltransferase FUT6-like n=1 Tax=Heteronotia binoei TaxID=13085 RepID=UPI00292EDA53|nr:4-galactosyl-N-acetylglucosaminide 3-alpha-L-fucosyltransferase FUT6-like [Heteronotia binoei]